MSRTLWPAALAAAFAVGVWTCSDSSPGAARVSIGVDPETIDNKGQEAVIIVEGTDETGKPGTGSVKLWTEAGSLRDGGTTLTLDKKGQGKQPFSCAVAADPACTGLVRIDAEWKRSGAATTTNFRRIQVSDADAG